jgi:hypothetical protein
MGLDSVGGHGRRTGPLNSQPVNEVKERPKWRLLVGSTLHDMETRKGMGCHMSTERVSNSQSIDGHFRRCTWVIR